MRDKVGQYAYRYWGSCEWGMGGRGQKSRGRQEGSERAWFLDHFHQLQALGNHHLGMGAGRATEGGEEEVHYLGGLGATQKMQDLFIHAILYHPSICLSIYLSIHLFIHSFIFYLFIPLYVTLRSDSL